MKQINKRKNKGVNSKHIQKGKTVFARQIKIQTKKNKRIKKTKSLKETVYTVYKIKKRRNNEIYQQKKRINIKTQAT